jgi:ATP-binding cassette, subfamily A (ABC1), member 3
VVDKANLFCSTTASAWDKFLLLSWKNWIIQIRHPIQTIVEILVPVLVCALVILIRGLVDIEEFVDDFRYSTQVTTQINASTLKLNENLNLAYSPANPLLQNLVQNVVDDLNFNSVVPLQNATELENFAMSFVPFASIEFEDSLAVRT